MTPADPAPSSPTTSNADSAIFSEASVSTSGFSQASENVNTGEADSKHSRKPTKKKGNVMAGLMDFLVRRKPSSKETRPRKLSAPAWSPSSSISVKSTPTSARSPIVESEYSSLSRPSTDSGLSDSISKTRVAMRRERSITAPAEGPTEEIPKIQQAIPSHRQSIATTGLGSTNITAVAPILPKPSQKENAISDSPTRRSSCHVGSTVAPVNMDLSRVQYYDSNLFEHSSKVPKERISKKDMESEPPDIIKLSLDSSICNAKTLYKDESFLRNAAINELERSTKDLNEYLNVCELELKCGRNLLNKKEAGPPSTIKESSESSQTIDEQDGEKAGGSTLKHENTVVRVDTTTTPPKTTAAVAVVGNVGSMPVNNGLAAMPNNASTAPMAPSPAPPASAVNQFNQQVAQQLQSQQQRYSPSQLS
uniref:Uncharacterized protein n=1 Tax=Acrobeloides nanus TaxID=290746 RepID=A0A914C413_9BILA